MLTKLQILVSLSRQINKPIIELMPNRTTFADTPAKEKIRTKIVRQFKQWFQDKEVCKVYSLPGRKWFTEEKIISHVEKFKQKRFTLFCFEKYWEVIDSAPDWVEIGRTKCGPNWYDFRVGSNGDFRYPSSSAPSFAWADYCGTPLEREVKKFRHSIKLGDIIYLTFSVIPRYRWSIDKDCLPAMELDDVSKRAPALVSVLETMIEKKIGKKFSRILYKPYINREGKQGQSHMITVGWHFIKNSPLAI